MRLWDEGSHARLIMIGHCEPAAREEGELMHQLLHEKRFRHIRDATDATIRECFRHARALIYPSKYEGFGLPPIEALHAGVPVVVWRGLPSLQGLSDVGQIRLEEISSETIAEAVKWMLDDNNAQRIWADAVKLKIPTWGEFAQKCAAWVQA